ncbi:hypothetical protein M5K25_000732 [Dendrobium thyrsiflorum]|uniref:Uncharacterized protein n=1 Tax=Dendrobium thyrsiflorum TaxID=117978 RepID=A0ABD0VUB4_DENTH
MVEEEDHELGRFLRLVGDAGGECIHGLHYQSQWLKSISKSAVALFEEIPSEPQRHWQIDVILKYILHSYNSIFMKTPKVMIPWGSLLEKLFHKD